VPIIIGILVGIVVLTIIVFFLVKKKRSQNKYDAEKAGADKDETAKLNAEVAES
jgi:flagellar basal body-associated protein FliL